MKHMKRIAIFLLILLLFSFPVAESKEVVSYYFKMGGPNWANVSITGGTINGTNITVGAGKTLDVSAGTLTLANDQISGDKVEGGTINATTINTLTSTTVNATTLDTNIAAAGVTLAGTTLSADGTDADINIAITPKGTGEVDISKVDIDSGTIDGATIATSDITVGAGKTLNVSAGTLTLSNDQISGDKVEGGTINSTTINTLTSTTVNATTLDTNIAAAGVTLAGTTLSADGTDADINIAITPKGTGEVDITKVDIDSGTIDGATIATSDVTVGAGKTIDVSAGTLTLANDQISGDKVEGGTINATTVNTLTTGSITNAAAITVSSTGAGVNITTHTDATDDFTVNTTMMVVEGDTGYVGLGESAPETFLEMASTVPYMTLHNTTAEDTDGGRESRINFKGHQSGDEETTLARIEASHDGTSDDEKGVIIFSPNDGDDGDSPTEAMRIDGTEIAASVPFDVGGTWDFEEDPGLVTFMQFLTSATGADAQHGILIKAENTNLLAIQAEADGAGDVKNPGIGIGTSTVDDSAILEVSSTTQGMLPPRMTTTQRDNISSPVAGLEVYNTTLKNKNVYDGSTWQTAGNKKYGQMYMYESALTQTIDTVDEYHLMRNFSTGALLNGFTFDAGSTGPIASFEDYSGTVAGTIKANDVGHGLITGDDISITGTSAPNDYNGVYTINRIDDDSFYFTNAGWNATTTATWSEGSYLQASAEAVGVYKIAYSITGEAAVAAKTFKFEIFINSTEVDEVASSMTPTGTNMQNCSHPGGIISIAEGDRIYMAIANSTDSNDFDLEHAGVIINGL